MWTVAQDKSISKLRSFGGQSKANDTAPVMGNYDSMKVLVLLAGVLLVLFSCSNDEFSDSLQHTRVWLLKCITSPVVRQIKTNQSCRLHGYSRLFQATPPHHTAVRKAMEKDEQIALSILFLCLWPIRDVV